MDTRHSSLKETILYISPWKASFVEKDIKLLSEQYYVVQPSHHWANKKYTPLYFIKQLIFLLRNGRHSKAIIVMFAGYWSIIPAFGGKILGIPNFIILGGTDCVSFPSMNYGSLRKPLLCSFIKWSLKLCTGVAPVHHSLVKTKNEYIKTDNERLQGYLSYFPSIKTPSITIHNGFDYDLFFPEKKKKRNSFVTVAAVNNAMRLELKGINKTLEIADKLPDCNFTLIGISEHISKKLLLPDNVISYPYLRVSKFKKILSESEFYLQLSYSEGFPNAICEGMLSGCIPIGSNVGATSDIIGQTGVILHNSNSNSILENIQILLGKDAEYKQVLSTEARDRIKKKFPLKKRKQGLINLIEKSVQR